jgi:hypothetical protein
MEMDGEVEAVAWAILQALHVHVPQDKRPQGWSDVQGENEQRIKAAAVAAIETIRSRDGQANSVSRL